MIVSMRHSARAAALGAFCFFWAPALRASSTTVWEMNS